MRHVRWWGLGAFVVLVGGTVLLWILFADLLVRRGIEAAGTRMVGARVELAAADVSFSPARLELRGLAVTNADEPMRNALEAERIAFDIDWIGLLLDRVHIDEVAVQGVQFGTERQESGAILGTERAVRRAGLLDTARRRLEIPPLEVPSAGSVLEREGLRSPEVIAGAQQTLKQRRKALDERLADLPGGNDLTRYERELDEATAGKSARDKLEGLERLRDLANDIDDDLKRLRRARDEMKDSLAAARQAGRAASAAPQADIDRLYRKYTDPGAVAGELAHYLLGPKVENWVNSGWYWYGRLSPYLGGAADDGAQATPAMRRPGRVVAFPGAAAEPEVLVRRVRISGAAGGGDLDGRVTDIAMPAASWSEPLRVHLAGNRLAGLQALRLDASVDRRVAGSAKSRIDLDASGLDVAGLALGPRDSLRTDRGRASFRVAGTVNGGALDLAVSATIREAAFRAGEGVEPVLREVARALTATGRIDIGARVGGTVESPELSLTSSLQDLLAPLLRSRLQQAASGFRDDLAEAVRDRTREELGQVEASLEQLAQLEAQLAERVDGFEQTLKQVRRKLD